MLFVKLHALYDHVFAGSIDPRELKAGELAASVGRLALSDGRAISGPPVNMGRLAYSSSAVDFLYFPGKPSPACFLDCSSIVASPSFNPEWSKPLSAKVQRAVNRDMEGAVLLSFSFCFVYAGLNSITGSDLQNIWYLVPNATDPRCQPKAC